MTGEVDTTASGLHPEPGWNRSRPLPASLVGEVTGAGEALLRPGALDALFAPAEATRATGAVRFSHEGYDVHDSSNGEVHVVEADDG